LVAVGDALYLIDHLDDFFFTIDKVSFLPLAECSLGDPVYYGKDVEVAITVIVSPAVKDVGACPLSLFSSFKC
jgi:hypothetical protein